MKIMEIVVYGFILSLVLNGLAVLRIASTSFGTSTTDVSSPTVVEAALYTHVGTVLVVALGTAIVAWIALANIPLTSGGHLPYDKIFAYTLFSSVLTTNLYAFVNVLFNIYHSVPVNLQLGVAVTLGIILSIISLVATIGFVELTLGKEVI